MIPAFRFLLLILVYLASLSVSAQSERKVYVTKTGARYHLASCRYAKTGWPATLSEAKDRGLTPCLVCEPGRGAAASSATNATSNSLKSATPSSKPATTTSPQCRATTKAGSRCSRKASSGSSYCWQHAG